MPGLPCPQTVAGDACRRVAAPADVVEVQFLAAVLHRDPVLQIALLFGLFNQAITNQQHLVAADEIELLRLARERLGG